MVYSIQILRGLAAALIVVHHFNQMLPDKHLGLVLFGFGGASGVDIFFLISGFVMVRSTENSRHAKPVDFALRRFFRVVPLAQICTLLYFLLLPDKPAFAVLLRSLCFVPLAAIDPPKFGWSLIPQLWTLSYELWFYVIFGLSLIITHKRRTLLTAAIVFSSIIFFQSISGGTFSWLPHGTYVPPGQKDSLHLVIFGVMGNPLLLEFVAGMFLAAAYRKFEPLLDTPRRRVVARIVGMTLILAFVAVYFSAYDPGHGLLNKHGYSAVCLVLGALLVEASFPWPFACTVAGKLLPLFIWLGAISYPLYVVHLGIVDALVRRFSSMVAAIPTDGLGGFLLYVALSIGLAQLLHQWVELPCVKIGKWMVERRSSPA